ncbi:hypothetical protein D3C76_1053650 [compost metagenome]
MVGAQACSISILDQRIGEPLGFLGALVVGQSQYAGRCRRRRERIDQAKDVAAHSPGRRPDAAEHVLQLTTLLEEHGQRGLATLQADRDVGELGRQAAQGILIGLGRHSGLVHAGRCAPQLFPGILQASGVFLECVRVEQSGLVELAQLFLHRIQAVERGHRGVDLPNQAGQLLALLLERSVGLLSATGNRLHACIGLACTAGHLLEGCGNADQLGIDLALRTGQNAEPAGQLADLGGHLRQMRVGLSQAGVEPGNPRANGLHGAL